MNPDSSGGKAEDAAGEPQRIVFEGTINNIRRGSHLTEVVIFGPNQARSTLMVPAGASNLSTDMQGIRVRITMEVLP